MRKSAAMRMLVVAVVVLAVACNSRGPRSWRPETNGAQKQLWFDLNADPIHDTILLSNGMGAPPTSLGSKRTIVVRRDEEECHAVPSLHTGCPGAVMHHLHINVSEARCEPAAACAVDVERGPDRVVLTVEARAGDGATLLVRGKLDDGRVVDDSIRLPFAALPDQLRVELVKNGEVVPGDVADGTEVEVKQAGRAFVRVTALAKGLPVFAIPTASAGPQVTVNVAPPPHFVGNAPPAASVQLDANAVGDTELHIRAGSAERRLHVVVIPWPPRFTGPAEPGGSTTIASNNCDASSVRIFPPSADGGPELHVIRALATGNEYVKRIGVSIFPRHRPFILVLDSHNAVEWSVQAYEKPARVFVNGNSGSTVDPHSTAGGLPVETWPAADPGTAWALDDPSGDVERMLRTAEEKTGAKVTSYQGCAVGSFFRLETGQPDQASK